MFQHIYNSALFWADKVVALTENARDIYWLAQCMYLLKQYHRAAHLLRTKNLEKVFINVDRNLQFIELHCKCCEN